MKQSILNSTRVDKFILVLDVPEILKNSIDPVLHTQLKADSLQFTTFGSPVPKITIPAIALPYGGQTSFVSSHSREKTPSLILNYQIDNGFQNYWLLWKWLNYFNDAELSVSDITTSNGMMDDKNISIKNPLYKYLTNFVLYGLDEYNNKIISFTYSDVLIVSLGEIGFSHQKSEIITGTVEFAYNQLKVELLENVSEC
jgi:hypothetical protein